eukprot:gnl/TRDRNA2_/TRDRNA2_193910_c0_seq1.p2 gnl/TRDRNA2_/TRDRNA2_193910_c0~~gnl/TRDRNA2_/TRDRNA2_193910_c0_seq1.p2  ORF type:complete len:226 (+),score=36.16 gnl/TRDRNA2_/TRDRNA2_193910_c0_seq1:139-816(+)
MMLQSTVERPPSVFAIKMRPWMFLCIGLLFPVIVARVLAQDVLGALFLAMTVGIGIFAVKEMDMAWLLCLSAILFLCAIWDLFTLIAEGAKIHWHIFDSRLPWWVNAVRFFIFAGPFIETAAACLCWFVCKEQMVSLTEDEFWGVEVRHPLRGARGFREQDPLVENVFGSRQGVGVEHLYRLENARQQLGGRRPSPATYKAYGGTGHKLGDDVPATTTAPPTPAP